MREKILLALNIVLFVTLISVFIIARKTFENAPKESIMKGQVLKKEAMPIQERQIYNINKIRPEEKAVFEEPKDLTEVYKNFPKEDVGDDDAAAWSRIKDEEKAEMMKDSDREIEKYKKALADNPKDKRAKSLLFIAESIKEMETKGFNESVENPVSKNKVEPSKK